MKIAFAGLRHGHMLALLEEIVRHPEYEFVGAWLGDAAYQGDRESALALRQSLNGKWFESYEEILNDDRIAAVAIGDYYGARGQEIIRALQAGKMVMCDKPVCTRLSELEKIEALLKSGQGMLACMLDLRYDPALRLAARQIAAGKLGTIHAVNFTGQHPLDWGQRPMWYFEGDKHGGTFNDLAIHGLDAVRWITGLECEEVLCARAWNAFARERPAFQDCAQCMIRLTGGAGLTADVSYSAPAPSAFQLPGYWRFAFWGENGFLECRLGENEITIALAGDTRPTRIAAPAQNERFVDDFLRQARGEKIALGWEETIRSTRAALVLQQAAEEIRKEKLNS